MEKAENDGNLERISEPQEYLPELWSTEEKHDIFKRFKRPDLPLHTIAHGIIDNVNLFTKYLHTGRNLLNMFRLLT